jgi:hypothetical protein
VALLMASAIGINKLARRHARASVLYSQAHLRAQRNSANLLRPHRPRDPLAFAARRTAATDTISLYFCHRRTVNVYDATLFPLLLTGTGDRTMGIRELKALEIAAPFRITVEIGV